MLRRVLVAGQLAVAIVLVSSGVLLAKSLDRLLAEDIGFEPDALMTARISLTDAYYPEDADRSAFYDRLLARLAASPGIRSVAMTSNLPFAGSGITFSFEVEGAPPVGSGDEPLAGFRVIGPRYFESMGIPLRSGREFDERDRSGAAYVAAIDETLARQHFAGRDPIGARVRVAREWREVIAVVGAIRHTTLDVAPVPAIYVPFAQRTAGTMFVVVRGERRIPDAALVGDAVRAVDRSQPVRAVQPMNDYIAAVAGQPRFLAFIVGAFGSAALLIAALGVYGIVAFTVSRRANEYAIRIALGARPASIVRNALRDGLLLLGVGLPIGVVAALSLSGVLEGLLHQVRATDAGTLAFVTALFTVVTLGASWLPARRAAGVEPMRVLRAD
jgi:predicted permease